MTKKHVNKLMMTGLLSVLPGVLQIEAQSETNTPPTAEAILPQVEDLPQAEELPQLEELPQMEELHIERARAWRLSAGSVYRRLNHATITPGSRSTPGMIRNMVWISPVDILASVGPADGPSERGYSNGFVRQDPGTGLDGDTWYWGYDRIAQVGDDSLLFRGDPVGWYTFQREQTLSTDQVLDSNEYGAGIYVAAATALVRADVAALDLIVSGSWVPFSVRENASTLDVRQRARHYEATVVDTYDLMGVIPPDPPYAGTFDGPGALLPNTPADREIRVSNNGAGTLHSYNLISTELDIQLTTLSVGVQGGFNAGPARVMLGGGPTFNFVNVDGTRAELLQEESMNGVQVLARFDDASNEKEFCFGGFVHAGAGIQITDWLGFEVCCRYDLLQSVSGELGPANYDLDLDGISGFAALTLNL